MNGSIVFKYLDGKVIGRFEQRQEVPRVEHIQVEQEKDLFDVLEIKRCDK